MRTERERIGTDVPQSDLEMNPWRSMDRAPKNCTWVDVKIQSTGRVYRAHYASGGGEEQPPYEGWFEAVYRLDGSITYMAGIPEPFAWRPISWAKVDQEKYLSIRPRPSSGFFQNFPGCYCKKCGEVFALYSYSGLRVDGDDENNKPFYNGCLMCGGKTMGDVLPPDFPK